MTITLGFAFLFGCEERTSFTKPAMCGVEPLSRQSRANLNASAVTLVIPTCNQVQSKQSIEMIYDLLLFFAKVVQGKKRLKHNHAGLVVHLSKGRRQSFYLTVNLFSPLRGGACRQMLLVLHKVKTVAAAFFLRAGKIR